MRILILSQWFQPEPFFKGLPFAKALKEKGHHVEVLTGFPNYPGGKIYPGYRIHLYQRELMGGIQVSRVPLYPSHDKAVFRRILNYLSFAISSFFVSPWLVNRPDIIYVFNLITLGPTAYLLRLLHGAKVIFDVTDLWPESVAASRMLQNKRILALLKRVCKFIYNKADRIVVLSPGFKDNLVERGIKPDKIDVFYNWCDESSIHREKPNADLAIKLGMAGKFIVLFAGTMGIVQGLDTLLDCARICRSELPHVQFILVGGGVDRPRLEKRANKMGLDNLMFLPPRPRELMGEIFAIADALIVHLKDDSLFRITIPSKTQAYLYIGKPIIMAVRGDAAELVRRAGAGIICEPENPGEIVKAIKTLYSMSDEERKLMGESGSNYYKNFLSFTSGVNQFEKLMLTTQ